MCDVDDGYEADYRLPTTDNSEIHPQLSDDRALDDVAEDVLLDLLVAEVGALDRRRQACCSAHFTPKPPLTSV